MELYVQMLHLFMTLLYTKWALSSNNDYANVNKTNIQIMHIIIYVQTTWGILFKYFHKKLFSKHTTQNTLKRHNDLKHVLIILTLLLPGTLPSIVSLSDESSERNSFCAKAPHSRQSITDNFKYRNIIYY